MNTRPVKNESAKTSNKDGEPAFIEFSDGRRLAYTLSEGKLPGVVFLGGFNSDMTGTKAMALEAFCRRQGQRFLRFDYTGHGQSSGDFVQGTIGDWKRDAIDMLEHIAPGQNILVGSSMGGWIMLLAALTLKEKVAGLVGIASAPDFTEMLLWVSASDEQKKQLEEEGVIMVPSCSGEDPYPITRTLIEEARNHLVLGAYIPLDIPVRLIHGMQDEDVSWKVSEKLVECLVSSDVTLTLIKNGGHRLSEPEQLEIIFREISALLA